MDRDPILKGIDRSIRFALVIGTSWLGVACGEFHPRVISVDQLGDEIRGLEGEYVQTRGQLSDNPRDVSKTEVSVTIDPGTGNLKTSIKTVRWEMYQLSDGTGWVWVCTNNKHEDLQGQEVDVIGTIVKRELPDESGRANSEEVVSCISPSTLELAQGAMPATSTPVPTVTQNP